MNKVITGGAKAAFNGERCETIVQETLEIRGYRKNPEKNLSMFLHKHNELFPGNGQYARKCRVPLIAHYHQGMKRHAEVDFVIMSMRGDLVLLSVKSQHVNGTAEEKLEYEVQQLIATELPSAMLVYGPMRGRDDESGWNSEVLYQIWERAKYFGAGRVLLFRTPERLSKWIDDGLPTPRGTVTSAAIFAQYCDREP